MRHTTLFLSLALAAGCADGTTEPLDVPALPPQMLLEADASGTAGDRQISCEVSFLITVARQGDSYAGQLGGDVRRSNLDATQAGIAFWGEAQSEARITFGPDRAIAIVSYRDGAPIPVVTNSRFWEGVRRFDGTLGTGPVLAEGPWTCAPMDTREDTAGTVEGTWRLTALP